MNRIMTYSDRMAIVLITICLFCISLEIGHTDAATGIPDTETIEEATSGIYSAMAHLESRIDELMHVIEVSPDNLGSKMALASSLWEYAHFTKDSSMAQEAQKMEKEALQEAERRVKEDIQDKSARNAFFLLDSYYWRERRNPEKAYQITKHVYRNVEFYSTSDPTQNAELSKACIISKLAYQSGALGHKDESVKLWREAQEYGESVREMMGTDSIAIIALEQTIVDAKTALGIPLSATEEMFDVRQKPRKKAAATDKGDSGSVVSQAVKIEKTSSGCGNCGSAASEAEESKKPNTGCGGCGSATPKTEEQKQSSSGCGGCGSSAPKDNTPRKPSGGCGGCGSAKTME